ncbi:alpha/beta hydrolase [Rhodoplanes sp. TEM]|uniref:Alpha/beta hydrolase n=1 Tax=Rhodoplanes tepidamans TaxID=200616 RepID=A0ABT5JJS2_RHOTP|nr:MULTISPECIES: alpha/beta hydrolase [Rhodoplanes]MDC7789958.1 alpha/beta hydrolase [Rhodoplanes tepidamans]MDC7985761.1 alpha/beta hydrolase [Rhodoplanes sp. TEM]MDQ0357282.1 pimeloyl-ACP methyl ester carboxylesterase [Rhodoplanes tepidamans]
MRAVAGAAAPARQHPTDADPVLLIHGAWQGAWAWDAFVPELAAAGLAFEAIDLPGNGTTPAPRPVSLDLYVEHVRAAIARRGRPVSLVAHSGGGLVASQVAEADPDGVARIVYVAGMMLPDGMAYADLVRDVIAEHPEAAGIGPHLVWSADRASSTVPEAAALAFFYHDCDAAAARSAARQLTAQPEGGRAVRPRLTAARFGRVPRLYVEATADRSVVPILQRRMQALVPGAAVVSLPTGHAPQLVAPRLLAEAIVPFLTTTTAAADRRADDFTAQDFTAQDFTTRDFTTRDFAPDDFAAKAPQRERTP